ncbi:MAG: hypothetical protein KF830_16890 [Planctomycetes bacterium]|nr:hypothetical protein [Planctomycetota bacterium]
MPTPFLRPGLALFAAVVVASLVEAQDGGAAGQVQRTPAPGPQGVPQAPAQPGRLPGNSWFPVTELDLGSYFGEGEASGVFRWKNPTQSDVTWSNLLGSCQCIRAEIRAGERRYELRPKQANPLVRIGRDANGKETQEPVTQIAIGPGEEGEVEVHLDMHGINGPKMATLDIHSSDPALPQIKLRWNAFGAQLFTISPTEVQLNKMTWNETREFQVTVLSPMKRDFNILRMDDAGKAFDVRWEKTMVGENATWTIKGTYGPVGEDVAGGGVLKFHTDVNGSTPFTVRVMAFVQGPLEVKPGGFLTLGMIRQGSGLRKEVVFEPNDGTNLELLGYRFEKLRGEENVLKVSSAKDGNKLVVTLEVSDKAAAGLLKGDLVLELNHPLVKERRIMFNGFVR